MSEPTEEQIKEFWEKLGVRSSGNLSFYQLPDDYTPKIDLNNLFKWAVPKLTQQGGHPYSIKLVAQWGEFHKDYGVEITNPTLSGKKRIALEFNKNPALALFWAIYKVIKEVEK